MNYFKTITLKDGRICRLRNGTEQDGPSVLEFFILAHGQTDYLLTYPDETGMTAKQEAEFLKAKTESGSEIELLAEIDGQVVGTAGFERVGLKDKIKHRAEFGISIDQKYWGLGIGRALTRACIDCAGKAGYAQLELEVVAENRPAIALYQSEGFVEYGRNPRGFRSRLTGWQTLVLMRLELNGEKTDEAEEKCICEVDGMENPWKEISLSDYENHMRHESVQQLQAMNRAMKKQFDRYPVTTVMILGIAGGNGLDQLDAAKYQKVYGVDINPLYLLETRKRYPRLADVLECLYADLRSDAQRLPHAELLIANLLIEYIGYAAFQNVVKAVGPKYVSCIIQCDEGEGFVSDSPYLHAFDRLDEIHCQLRKPELTEAMRTEGYRLADEEDYPLPNGKKLIRLDYTCD